MASVISRGGIPAKSLTNTEKIYQKIIKCDKLMTEAQKSKQGLTLNNILIAKNLYNLAN